MGKGMRGPGQVIPVTWGFLLQWLPCQAPALIASSHGLDGLLSVYWHWVRQQVWSATSISVWQHAPLSKQIHPLRQACKQTQYLTQGLLAPGLPTQTVPWQWPFWLSVPKVYRNTGLPTQTVSWLWPFWLSVPKVYRNTGLPTQTVPWQWPFWLSVPKVYGNIGLPTQTVSWLWPFWLSVPKVYGNTGLPTQTVSWLWPFWLSVPKVYGNIGLPTQIISWLWSF